MELEVRTSDGRGRNITASVVGRGVAKGDVTLATLQAKRASPQSSLEGTKRPMWIASSLWANQMTLTLRLAAAPRATGSSTNLPMPT